MTPSSRNNITTGCSVSGIWVLIGREGLEMDEIWRVREVRHIMEGLLPIRVSLPPALFSLVVFSHANEPDNFLLDVSKEIPIFRYRDRLPRLLKGRIEPLIFDALVYA